MRRCVFLLLALGVVSSAYGQDLPRTSDLQPVFVRTTGAGAELKGQLLDLSDDTLALLVDGQRVGMPLQTIARIQTRGDSVRNGALIGALVLGGWCAIICGQGLDGGATLPVAVIFNAALGVAIGAGIDAFIPGRTTIYNRPSLPDGRESWTAKDLGVVTRTKKEAAGFATSMELRNLSTEEPNPAMFAIPPDCAVIEQEATPGDGSQRVLPRPEEPDRR
jgi:hypothetical protein